MILMPQIRGAQDDNPEQPRKRIANTRKVLIVSAIIMSVYLLGAALVATLLIPAGGSKPARPRTAALWHTWLTAARCAGHGRRKAPCWSPAPQQGICPDIVTVLMLCFAGTSVMTALSVLLPQFLLRFGMEMRWANRWGVLLMIFGLINLLVTLYFKASVDAQRGAYTTSVLVLMSSAALVAATERRRRFGQAADFILVAGGLTAITLAVAVLSLSGILIASLFILAILVDVGAVTRTPAASMSCTLIGFEFKDNESKLFWDTLRCSDFPVLVPHRPGKHERDVKEEQIRREHQLSADADVVFVEIHLDDPSDFFQNLLVEVVREERRFVIKVTRCCSVAHAIAAVALEMSRYSKPPGLHFGWTDMDLLSASWTYLAFGQGNIPWKVRELIMRAEPDRKKAAARHCRVVKASRAASAAGASVDR